ncbi:hypothetical protein BV25DRAFT_234654 [Artomyces pyxidatus]|uniref:Uncharacterized protein n=1 Tax=Artomyces pyxidatus TaxID=48021 RepID=A0ACB8SHK8_9AGAM|nr:hypothetical protein BV25DRAFT_234654 [Artomyces pyxidatus]
MKGMEEVVLKAMAFSAHWPTAQQFPTLTHSPDGGRQLEFFVNVFMPALSTLHMFGVPPTPHLVNQANEVWRRTSNTNPPPMPNGDVTRENIFIEACRRLCVYVKDAMDVPRATCALLSSGAALEILLSHPRYAAYGRRLCATSYLNVPRACQAISAVRAAGSTGNPYPLFSRARLQTYLLTGSDITLCDIHPQEPVFTNSMYTAPYTGYSGGGGGFSESGHTHFM